MNIEQEEMQYMFSKAKNAGGGRNSQDRNRF